MGKLRDRMIEEMKQRNFSPATQASYVYAVSRLAKYHHKSPDQLSKEDIRAFLVHLTVERKLSPSSLTGYCSGLRFLYNETLGWDETKLFIPPRKKPSVLPEIFSPDEVMRLIGAARGLKQRVLLMTAYPFSSILPVFVCCGLDGNRLRIVREIGRRQRLPATKLLTRWGF
jgi:integrase/recombinase XerD